MGRVAFVHRELHKAAGVHVHGGFAELLRVHLAYGAPAEGIDAVQLEISQRTYMDEDSFAWDEDSASRLQPLLHRLLEMTLVH